MATLCNRCGQPLLREDASFCNHCGAKISPQVSSSPPPRRTQVIADQPSSPASGADAGERAGGRPVLREQIAFAPSASSLSPAAPDDVPPWLSRLDKMGASPASRPRTQNFSPDTPPGVENPLKGRPPAPGSSQPPQRELRARIWEGEDANSPGQAEEPSRVEDRPTVPVPSAPAGKKDAPSSSPAAQHEQVASDIPHASEGAKEDVDLPTRPLVARLSMPEQLHTQRSSERPFPAQSYRQAAVPPQPLPAPQREQQQGFPAQPTSNPVQPLIRQQPAMSPVPPSSPGFPQPAAAPVPAERTPAPAPARPVRRKSRMRLVVVLVMLLVLLGGGLIYWIVAYQPFSVPAVTSTSLSFSSAQLGIALQYPQGWTNQLNSAHQTATFFDANHVDQLSISVTSANGTNATAYASKEAAQLGLTAQKNLSPITFAGTTWQRVQGTVLVSGATDTETVLVAQHGNHLYAMTQIAPAATYADADRLFFAIFRAHFQFL